MEEDELVVQGSELWAIADSALQQVRAPVA